MERKYFFWLFLFLLLFFSILTPRTLPFSSGVPTIQPLIEIRELELTFIGIEEIMIDNELISSSFKFNESVFTSEMPSGDILSSVNFTLNVNVVHSSFQDLFITQLYSQSTQVVNTSDYFIKYDSFYQILNDSSLLTPVEFNVYRILIFNLAYIGSPFNGSNLYLNYSASDYDTNHFSALRPYSSYGVSFSLNDQPTIGILVSSEPHFAVPNYPLYQKVISGELNKTQWNTNLIELIEQALWCRFNPSPSFRYNAHQTLTLHLSLVGMDQSYSFNDIGEFLDQDFIQTKFEDLLMISEVEIKTVLINATPELQSIALGEGETFSVWSTKIADYLKSESLLYWDQTYTHSNTKYLDKLDLYIAILVGNESYLSYTPTYVGTTFYTSETSEYGDLALVTLTYDMLFNQHEGLSLATIHEVAHLLGLNHPHDYWQPINNQVEPSWSWGYTTSPLTYLCTGYQWDYFDRLLIWCEQIYSLLNTMSESAYETNQVQVVYNQIEQGSFSSLNDSLQHVVDIYLAYQARIQSQNTYLFVLSSMIVTTCVMGTSVIIWRFQRKK